MLTAYMNNIFSQLYNVSFQKYSELPTTVLPLLFTQPSYFLDLFMDQPPYKEFSKDLISMSQTELFHADRQTNIITAVSTHVIDKMCLWTHVDSPTHLRDTL